MWCIPKLDKEFKERMEDVLNLYEADYDSSHPVVCMDEKSKQLLADSRSPMGIAPGKIAIRDYEYVRKGTANIFVAVEAKGGRHFVEVTARRTKEDYGKFLLRLAKAYSTADCIHIVQDNLNTHSEKSLIATFGKHKTNTMMKRIKFHFTPKHASWLNMAEIEIGILSRQCLKGRIPTADILKKEVSAWTTHSNKHKRKIQWKFTTEKAQNTFPQLYEQI